MTFFKIFFFVFCRRKKSMQVCNGMLFEWTVPLNKFTFTTRVEGHFISQKALFVLNVFALQFSKPLPVIPVQLPVSLVQFYSNPAHELKGSHFFSCEFCPALLQKNRMCKTEEMWGWQLENFLNGPAFTSWAEWLCIPQTWEIIFWDSARNPYHNELPCWPLDTKAEALNLKAVG